MSTETVERSRPRKKPPELAIIDCDLHNELDSVRDLYPYLAKRWRDHIDAFGIRKYTGSDYPRFMPHREDARPPSGRQCGSDVEFTARDHLDRHNVAYGILIALTPVGRMANQALDVALASAVNEWHVAEWLDRDPRLRASMAIPADDPPRAVEEIERHARDGRFVQVHFSGRPGEPMGRRKYWPIFEACERHGLAVMTHAFGSAGNPLTGTGWPSYYIEEHIGPAQTIQGNVTSMVIEGVFERFPSLRLVSVENTFGWLPALMWRLDRSWKLLRQEVPHLTRSPSEYLASHVYVATQPMEEPPKPGYLTQLLEHGGGVLKDRLLFASDYPHWDSDSPEEVLPAHLPDELRRKIYFENARALYGLP